MTNRIIILALSIYALSTTAVADTKHARINKSLAIYTDALRQLDINYVDTINYELLTETSINAMLKQIDPYTVYIPESQTDDLKFMTTGAYGGIGAVISERNGLVQISDPYEGMPAQRNDVRAGDYILSIDGKRVKGYSVSQVSALLKGKTGEAIKITLQRGDEKKVLKKEFLREEIQIHPVAYYELLPNNVGYLKLTEFTDKAAAEFKKAMADMNKNSELESLVIDLRNNGGGIIDEAVKILSLFVPKGTEVVSTRGRNGEESHVYKTTTDPLYPQLRIAVLTNGMSASASEIVAGALQDLDAAVLIGERTFGKGLVQSIQALSHNAGYLKVTTAKYHIPSGRCIQAIDYQKRGANGNAMRVPDSLTTEFKTRNGRIVRDGGGIQPDIDMTQAEKLNIVYYLYIQHKFFDFATLYKNKHASISPAAEFEVTPQILAEFEEYLNDQKFTYTSETQRQFKRLLEVASVESIDSIAQAEFDALKLKIEPNISRSLALNVDEVKLILGSEIVKRYYYQKGETAYMLRHDKEFDKATEILSNEHVYHGLLRGKVKRLRK